MNRTRSSRGALSYANVMATVAVFIALGGIAGAAVKPLLDKQGSVKGRHIARGAVHMSDLAPSVRNQIAEPPIPPANFTGQATDGSFSIKALIDFGPTGGTGQILAMSATGDCAFPYQRGDWYQNSAVSRTGGHTFKGWGAESASATAEFTTGGFIVTYVRVGDPEKSCDGRATLHPV
jgi:hypothetical protein